MPVSAWKLAVVAFGGNAILRVDERGTVEEQARNLAGMARQLGQMVVDGWGVVVTHGNGPQVGNLLLQQEAGEPQVPGMPLDVCGAMSQGQIGYMVAESLQNEFARRRIERPVATLLTRCLVDLRDPASTRPSKPIGPFYDPATAERLRIERGWRLMDDAGRGLRRAVPSPRPLRIVEREQVRMLVRSGAVVIACGGGGVPVVELPGGRLRGVEAVIDKDFAASLLARELGASTLVLLTQVPAVALYFGRAGQRELGEVSLDELEAHATQGQFATGSMAPKVEAAIEFLRGGGELAIITMPELLAEALAGRAGTRVRVKGKLLASPQPSPRGRESRVAAASAPKAGESTSGV